MLTEGEDQWVEERSHSTVRRGLKRLDQRERKEREALSEIIRVGSKLEWGRPPGTEIEANEARC